MGMLHFLYLPFPISEFYHSWVSFRSYDNQADIWVCLGVFLEARVNVDLIMVGTFVLNASERQHGPLQHI